MIRGCSAELHIKPAHDFSDSTAPLFTATYSINKHIPAYVKILFFRMPKSQLQFKVLNSYKQLLKASANRPSVQARVKNEFRQNKSIKRMELQLIEHKLRCVPFGLPRIWTYS